MLLRPRHYKAIELLVTTDMTKEEICEELEVSTCTLRSWMRQPEFKEELSRWQSGDPQSLRVLGMQAARILVRQMMENTLARSEDAPPGAVVAYLGKLMMKALEVPAPTEPPTLSEHPSLSCHSEERSDEESALAAGGLPESADPTRRAQVLRKAQDDNLEEAGLEGDGEESKENGKESKQIETPSEPEMPIATQECGTQVAAEKMAETDVGATHASPVSEIQQERARHASPLQPIAPVLPENSEVLMTNDPLTQPLSLIRH